jgi:hypothetical protein
MDIKQNLPSYAGIGSRLTPFPIQDVMRCLAARLSPTHKLISGGAEGADRAFERGCKGSYQIYRAHDATAPAIELASRYHPAWNRCTDFTKKLHGRNSMIILGADLNDPVKFVVCYTPDGKDTGGTGLGIRIATAYNIPIINLHDPYWLQRIKTFISK